MNWISGIGKALNYIENHLTEDIDYEELAKCACSSVFHFQRIFGILCDCTVGDYIRMRRLTLAGQDVIYTDEKIIDIALKYNYESPESFTRAFTRFHGVSPSEARKNGCIRSFSRLTVSLNIIGGNTMDYRIEKKPALKIVCRRQEVEKPASATAVNDIMAFWDKCGKDGSTKKLCEIMPDDIAIGGLLGICFTTDIKDNRFPYGIGFALGEKEIDTGDFDVVEIPANTYAVFTVKGKMPEAFQNTYKRICTEFFVTGDYEYANSIELEVYPSDDILNPNFTCEIWIAVKNKK